MHGRNENRFRDPGVAEFGLRNAVLPVGCRFLEVVSPVRADATAARYMDRLGGDGGYMVLVQTADLAADRRRLATLGVRVVWQVTPASRSRRRIRPRSPRDGPPCSGSPRYGTTTSWCSMEARSRFSDSTRGDRVAAVRLVATDASRTLATARARGLATEARSVWIGGVRFDLT